MVRVRAAKQHVRFWSPGLLAVTVLLGLLSSPGVAEETNAPVRTLKEAGMSAEPVVPQPSNSGAIAQTEGTPKPEATSADSGAFPRIPQQVNGSFTGGNGAGFDDSFFGLDGFIPLMQTPGKDLTYLQGRFLISTEGDPGGNVLVGYRRFDAAANSILGGYIGYDVRDSGRATFNQVSAGVEGIWSGVEFRANGYVPVGDTRKTVDRSTSTRTTSSTTNSTTSRVLGQEFVGNNLAIDVERTATATITTNTFLFNRRLDEIALAGFDAEAGLKVAQWRPDGDLRTYLGLYYYSGSDVSGFVGVRGRLLARINQYASIGASIQGDREFGTTGAVTVAFQFPGMSRSQTAEPTSNWARMGDSASRSNNIAITDRTTNTTSVTTSVSSTSTTTLSQDELARNPATGQPYIFEHVVLGQAGGNGTFENPFGIVANALATVPTDGNGIVYVQAGTNPGIPAFTIPNNVQVLSTGPSQPLLVQEFGQPLTVTLPLSGSGQFPLVTNTVTMGNNTVLSGFTVTPPAGNTGILANGVQTVSIRDNRVQATGADTPAVRLQNVTGTVNVSRNTLSTNGLRSDGVSLTPNGGSITTATVDGNTITTTSNTSRGVFVRPSGTARIENLAITNNGITTQGGAASGILLQSQSTNAGVNAIVNSTIAGNTITTTGTGFGIEAFLNQPTVPFQMTISNNTVQSGDSGIVLLTTATDGTATISGNTINRAVTNGIDIAAGGGGTVRAIVDNNTIANVTLVAGNIRGTQIGINIAASGNSQLFASVTNNQVSNSNAFVIDTAAPLTLVEYRFLATTLANPTASANLCTRVLNNFASNSGYLFEADNNGTLRREPLTGNTGTVQPNSILGAGTITNVSTGTCGF